MAAYLVAFELDWAFEFIVQYCEFTKNQMFATDVFGYC